MSFTHALKWSFLSELATKAIQPVVFVVLARLLTPEDFGVMTAAMMVMAFSQIFWEAGMGKALIQRQTHIEEAANVAFMINVSFGVLISCLLYLFAQPIAQAFFQDDRVTTVLQVMTLQVLMGALGSVQTALLQKEMGFKKLFWVRFATVGLPGFASLPMAWFGWGYWALVMGALVGQFAQVVMLWWISHWRPKLMVNWAVTKELSRFGAWVGVTGLLAWFYAWADSMVVGHYLGSRDLGLFNTGGKLPAILFTMIFGPVVPVLYSQVSKVGNEKNLIKGFVELAVITLTIIAVPISIILYGFSDQIELVVFGDHWDGLSAVLAGMGVVHGYSWIVGMNGEFYRAIGKPSYETIVTAVTLVFYFLVYLWVVDKGLGVFVIARAVLAIVALALHLFILEKTMGVRIFSIIKKIVLVTVFSVMVVFFANSAVLELTKSASLQLLYGLFFSGVLIFVPMFLMEKNNVIKNLSVLVARK